MILITENCFWYEASSSDLTLKNADSSKSLQVIICLLDDNSESIYKLGPIESLLWHKVDRVGSSIKDLSLFADENKVYLELVIELMSFARDNHFIETNIELLLKAPPFVKSLIDVTEINLENDLDTDSMSLEAYATCSAPCTCTRLKNS